MFSRRYDIYNFRQIAEKFLEYCSFWEETEDIAIVNYRYNTWQGATLAIPIDDYKVDESVTEGIYIFQPDVTGCPSFGNYMYNDWDHLERNIRYNIYSLINHLFPNSPKDSYWGFTDMYDYQNLDRIISRINTYSRGKLIFILTDMPNWTYSDIKNSLDAVNDACIANDVDVYFVYIPTYEYTDDFSNFLESYVYTNKPRHVLNFYTELSSIRDDMPEALAYDKYSYNDYRCMYSLTSEESGYRYVYSKNIWILISRFILSNIFKINREEYYVSLMYSENPKSWYSQLFTTYGEYMVEEFNYDQYIHGGWSIQSKYGSNPPNIFKNTGQLVSVGVHTSYDPFLWMCEQGGITCKKEEDEQINDLDLMDFWAFFNGTPNKRVKPPVFPTTGCPWFTISNKNIADYGIADCPTKLYITRVGSSFILTIRVIDANGQKPDLWQSITFGEFVGRQDGYNIDQFYCSGGNQALSPDSWTYFATSHIIGLQMDLDMKNSSIVNSNILHPSKFEKTNLSNFRIMNGEGTWEDIYSATQGYKEYQYLDGDGNPTIFIWGVPLTRPNFDIGESLNTAYPYLSWQNKIDTYTINKYDLKKNNMSGSIVPLTVYLTK